MDYIGKVLQSHEEFRLDEGVTVNFVHVAIPPSVGSYSPGMLQRRMSSVVEFALKKKTLINPPPPRRGIVDECCAERALLIGVALAEMKARGGKSDRLYKNTIRNKSRLTQEAHRLRLSIGRKVDEKLDLEGQRKLINRPCFESYDIHIFAVESLGKRVLHTARKREKHIYILSHGAHNYTVKNPGVLFGGRHYCDACGKAHQKKQHRCSEATCPYCQEEGCRQRGSLPAENKDVGGGGRGRFFERLDKHVYCHQCNRHFRTIHCYNRHQTNDSCRLFRKCGICYRFIPRSKWSIPTHGGGMTHKDCGVRCCRTCGQRVLKNETHEYCYIQPYKPKYPPKPDGSKEDIFALMGDDDEETSAVERRKAERAEAERMETKVYYCDAEAMFESGEHVPNLFVVEDQNGLHQQIFYGTTCVEDFFQWVQSLETNQTRLFMFHNLGHYDGYFILRVKMEFFFLKIGIFLFCHSFSGSSIIRCV